MTSGSPATTRSRRTCCQPCNRGCHSGSSKAVAQSTTATIPEVSAISPSNTPYSDTCHASLGKATVVIDTASPSGAYERHLRQTGYMRDHDGSPEAAE
jgi:hypothetical protein